jgi:2-polyprenyl-3-methyl-5-hydroxy-6-metoxy-1,4-benzoquinol methylase
MALLPPLVRAENAVEMLDRPVPAADRASSLRDVARLNAVFGGRWLTVRHVARLLAAVERGRRATVLDIGTGGADIPRALVRWARRAGRPLRVIAVDREAATLAEAGRDAGRWPEIVLVRADALALPVHPESVDVVIAALTLHHLEPPAAVACLAAMERAARRGFVVNDLVRSRAAYALVWVATRLLARSRLSRHDGPLSVRRAYTAAEVRRLCAEAGIAGVALHRYPLLLRQCAVRAKERS